MDVVIVQLRKRSTIPPDDERGHLYRRTLIGALNRDALRQDISVRDLATPLTTVQIGVRGLQLSWTEISYTNRAVDLDGRLEG